MLKKITITSAILIVILVVMFNIPGDIEPESSEQSKSRVLPKMPESASLVSIKLLETGGFKTPEAYTVAEGSLFKNIEMIHGAVLVTHRDDTFLFDTGLGENVDQQFEEDMPSLIAPFMAYEKGHSVFHQLENDSSLPKPNRIILSHAHWDHASGLVDFPNLDVWVTSDEYNFIQIAEPPAVFPSQVSSKTIQWNQYSLSADDYAGFENSLDVYQDGSIVIVSLSGHSPGSIGMFVNTSEGKRYFFIGDAVWNIDSVKNLKSKFWISSNLADADKDKTSSVVAALHSLMIQNPELKIVPAHDRRMWR